MLSVVLLVTGLSDSSMTAFAADAPREATVSVPSAKPGQRVEVHGAGWPKRTLVQILTCGQLGLNRSASCDLTATTATPTLADGTFGANVVVGRPPENCPCIIDVATIGTATVERVRIPFTVVGIPNSPIASLDPPSRSLDVQGVRIGDDESLGARLFGGVSRQVELTVRNPGTTAMVDIDIRATTAGPPFDVGTTSSVGTIARLDAGATEVVEVDVPLPTFQLGDIRIAVFAADQGPFVLVDDAVPLVIPLGIGAAVLLVVALLVLMVVKQMSRRRKDAAQGLPTVTYVPELGGYLVREGTREARRLASRSEGVVELGKRVNGARNAGGRHRANGVRHDSAHVGSTP